MYARLSKSGGCSNNRGAVTAIVAGVWLLLVAAGTAAMLNYSTAPGSAGAIPAQWPGHTGIALDRARPTLILFAHPHCPCTRATLAELAQLMTDCQGRLSAQVWFIKPAGTPDDWTNTDLWHTAASIPGVTVHQDVDSDEARRFQALTSGQATLYGREGKLLFHGGITISRGHEGDNPGLSAMEDLLNHKLAGHVQTPVFGCSLFSAECRTDQALRLCIP